jgi:dolichol-phosphate mannosyltransferase
VKLLRLSRNFGHQLRSRPAWTIADGDAVVIMDADLQDPPRSLPSCCEPGGRPRDRLRGAREPQRRVLAQALPGRHLLQDVRQMANVDVPLDTGDFRLVDRKVVDALKQVRELHRFVRGLTCWVGFSQTAVRYERAPRHAGVTKYPIWKLMRLAWDAITSFSSTPLRWMTLIGLLVSIAGLAQTVRVIVGRLLYPARWSAAGPRSWRSCCSWGECSSSRSG